MNNYRKIKAAAVFLLAVVVALVPSLCFAKGDGTGGGAGAVIPLYMDWSYPSDGASGVSVTPVIQCKFSHNVSQYNVRDRNKTLVEMTEDGGGKVDITVFMADTQLQFDKRQFIYVSPVKPLKYGTGYTLTLKEGIQAKNNMATDEDQSIHFVTGYGRSDFNAPLVAPPVSTELDSNAPGSDGDGAGASGSGIADAKDFFSEAVGSIGSMISGVGKSGDQAGAAGEGGADTAQDSTPGADAVGGVEDGDSSDSGLYDGTENIQNSYFENMISFVEKNLFLISVAALLVVSIVYGIVRAAVLHRRYGAAALMKRHGAGGNTPAGDAGASVGARARGRRIVSVVLAFVLVTGGAGIYGTDISYAGVPKSFMIRVLVGETVVSEKAYTDAELRQLKQTQQAFSGIDEEGLPCTVSAEGVLLTDYVASQGITEGEISRVTIYAPDKWQRSFINNYLYGVKRYRYPHLSEAWRIENGEDADEPADNAGDAGSGESDGTDAPNGQDDNGNGTSGSESENTEPGAHEQEQSQSDGASGTVSAQSVHSAAVDVDTAALRKSGAEQVYPMLALRSFTSEVSDAERYDALGASEGYRFCFGQLNPSDGAYMMYGYNLTGMDIIVSATGDFARSVGLEDKEGLKTRTPGGADSAGIADVAGPYEDKLTGESVSKLPDGLTIQIGYFGTDYYTIKRFSFEELAAMPLVRQAYSGRSASGKTGTLTALGVRLVDIVTAAGVDVSSVEKFGFYREDASVQDITSAGVTASSSWLIDMNRYYYPNMTNVIDFTTGKSGAALNSVRTDTLIALKDYWDEGSAVPDFFKLDGTRRFRLVYGQSTPRSDNLSKSAPWISTIRIQLYGSPSDENWLDDYIGKTFGDGSGAGVGGTGGGAVTGDKAQQAAGGGAVKNEPVSDSIDTDLERVNTSGKHVYEISAGTVSFSLDEKKNDHRRLIAAAALIMLAAGACSGAVSYRRRIFRKGRNR